VIVTACSVLNHHLPCIILFCCS